MSITTWNPWQVLISTNFESSWFFLDKLEKTPQNVGWLRMGLLHSGYRTVFCMSRARTRMCDRNTIYIRSWWEIVHYIYYVSGGRWLHIFCVCFGPTCTRVSSRVYRVWTYPIKRFTDVNFRVHALWRVFGRPFTPCGLHRHLVRKKSTYTFLTKIHM